MTQPVYPLNTTSTIDTTSTTATASPPTSTTAAPGGGLPVTGADGVVLGLLALSGVVAVAVGRWLARP